MSDVPTHMIPGHVDRAKLDRIAADIKSRLADAQVLLPKEARAVGGKYDGRLGKVTGAILWSGNSDHDEGILVGFYVYKLDRKKQPTKEVLNSDSESRRYRKLSELEFVYQGELKI